MEKEIENILADDSFLIVEGRKTQLIDKKRVAIFLENWVEALQRDGTTSKCLKCFRKGSMIFIDEDIERIIKSGAPVKVFVEEDANKRPKRSS